MALTWELSVSSLLDTAQAAQNYRPLQLVP